MQQHSQGIYFNVPASCRLLELYNRAQDYSIRFDRVARWFSLQTDPSYDQPYDDGV